MTAIDQGPHPRYRRRVRYYWKPLHDPRVWLYAALFLVVPMLALSISGCSQGPRMQAPFTLSDPSQRHPIQVGQGEAALDLSVSRNARGLNNGQWGRLYRYLAGYQERGSGGLVVRTPSGSANQAAAKRAYQDIRHAMRRAGISPRDVKVQPYYAKYDPAAPVRLSFVEYRAKGPDCPDWSENLARDPQNLPSPNMGCATQKNLAAMIADPQDLLYPRPEAPRPSERRDAVWKKYVAGEPTGSNWSPELRPLPERATSSEISAEGN